MKVKLNRELEKKELGKSILVTDAREIARRYAASMCKFQREIDADYLHIRAKEENVDLVDVERKLRDVPLMTFNNQKEG